MVSIDYTRCLIIYCWIGKKRMEKEKMRNKKQRQKKEEDPFGQMCHHNIDTVTLLACNREETSSKIIVSICHTLF